MPFLIVFAAGAAALVRVANTPDPGLLDIVPFLGAMMTVPLAYARTMFSTGPRPRD